MFLIIFTKLSWFLEYLAVLISEHEQNNSAFKQTNNNNNNNKTFNFMNTLRAIKKYIYFEQKAEKTVFLSKTISKSDSDQ